MDFFLRSTSSCSDRDNLRHSMYQPHGNKELLQHLSHLNQATAADIALIVLWKASLTKESGDKHIVTGQHHVVIDQINTTIKVGPEHKVSIIQYISNSRIHIRNLVLLVQWKYMYIQYKHIQVYVVVGLCNYFPNRKKLIATFTIFNT